MTPKRRLLVDVYECVCFQTYIKLWYRLDCQALIVYEKIGFPNKTIDLPFVRGLMTHLWKLNRRQNVRLLLFSEISGRILNNHTFLVVLFWQLKQEIHWMLLYSFIYPYFYYTILITCSFSTNSSMIIVQNWYLKRFFIPNSHSPEKFYV